MLSLSSEKKKGINDAKGSKIDSVNGIVQMTKEQFLELKEQLKNTIIEYEQLQRTSNFIKQAYLIQFSQELEEETYLNEENKVMMAAIKMKADQQTNQQIEEYLSQAKKEMKVKNDQFHTNLALAKDMEKRCSHYNPIDMQKLDQEYAEYCSVYHPIMKAHSTDMEKSIYNTLSMLYRMGNLQGFRGFLQENKDLLTSAPILEEDYDSLAVFYRMSIDNLSALIEKNKNSFPLTHTKYVSTYDDITAHIGQLREKLYQLKEMNQALHQDFKVQFSMDYNIES